MHLKSYGKLRINESVYRLIKSGFPLNKMLWILEAVIVVLASGLLAELAETKSCPSRAVPPKNLNCNTPADQKFRTINGSCNNYIYLPWGTAGQTFSRHTVSANSIETDTLRKSVSGKDLPNPRVISTTIHTDKDFESDVVNQFFVFFGLFVTHDIEKTVVPSSSGCCKKNSQKSCLPISIPANDSFYGKFDVKCLEYARSCKKEENRGSTRERRLQFSDNTVYLDLSQIYGSDESTARKLRTFSNGTLKTSVLSDGQQLLPTVEQAGMSGSVKGTFAAGDSRVNMFPQLTAIYTIFVLEHNRLAMDLQYFFPLKTDEWFYQRARRILIGIYQNIIYEEYLPLLIGKEKMKTFHLSRVEHRTSFYDGDLYPSIANENVVAGNLHVYSTISGTMRFRGLTVPLHQTLFNSSYVKSPGKWPVELLVHTPVESPLTTSASTKEQVPNGLFYVLHGMNDAAQEFDRFVTAELTNHFLQQDQQYGQDIVALTLQRGRDHSTASYVETVRRCTYGKIDIKNFDDIYGLMDSSNLDLLKQVYSDPRDIDLFTGGLSEKRIPGAVLGPTLACLQAEQFFTLKYGDRFFYTHKGSFPRLLYTFIVNFSLGDVACLNVVGNVEARYEQLKYGCKILSKCELGKVAPYFDD